MPRRTTTKSGRLVAQCLPIASFSAEDRAAAFDLFGRYYDGVGPSTFAADLLEKDDIIVLRDSGDGSLCGFTTIQQMRQTVLGREIVAVYSGDTIVDEAYWGQSALQRAFYHYLARTKLENLFRPVYWFLISKGFKTYLLLTRNVPNHFPRYDVSMPVFDKTVLDTLAAQKFGPAYEPATSVLRLSDHGRLRAGVAPIEAHQLDKPDIRFFVDANPGHAGGDELCCLGRVDRELLTTFIAKTTRREWRRMTSRARRLWAGVGVPS